MNQGEFYRVQHERTREALEQIKSGARFFRSRPSGPNEDITEEHRTTLLAQLEYWSAKLFGQTDG